MAMLKNKNITFSLIFMCLVVVSPMANAQLIGGILGGLPNLLNIQGRVMCSTNGSVSTSNATSIPPFPNAGVLLQCAGQNVSTTTTGANGVFSFPPLLQTPLTTLLSPPGCNILVTSPLGTCNASLPTDRLLMAPLNLVGTTFAGAVNILQFVSGLFRLV